MATGHPVQTGTPPTAGPALPTPGTGEGDVYLQSFREFLYQYNRLSEQCFMDCVRDFTSRTVSAKEETCALNCLEKYLKMAQRLSSRFQEYQVAQTDNAAAHQMH